MNSSIKCVKGGGGLEDISVQFLKLCASHVASHISYLLNLCSDSGTFSDVSKITKITPILKKALLKI